MIAYLDRWRDVLKGKRFAVAVSGGSDSLGLLLAVRRWVERNDDLELPTAITVDHGLREESAREAEYVAKICENWCIKHILLKWEGDKPKNNVESLARENRYRLLADCCRDGEIEYLLVAHHLEDQAETFLIRLFRGSGLDGLSAMAFQSEIYGLKIIRPFLEVHKSEIQNYLVENNVNWVEDPSNGDEKFLRNKFRKFLGTFEDREVIAERIGKTVKQMALAATAQREKIDEILNEVATYDPFGSCLINNRRFLAADDNMAMTALARIAMKISGNSYKPRWEKLERLFGHIKNAITNNLNNFRHTFYGCIFESYGTERIIVYREYNSLGDDVKLFFNETAIWDGRFKITLHRDIPNLSVSHVEEGNFNLLLRKWRKVKSSAGVIGINLNKLEKLRGVEKRIFYTLPFVVQNGEYQLNCDFVTIERL